MVGVAVGSEVEFGLLDLLPILRRVGVAVGSEIGTDVGTGVVGGPNDLRSKYVGMAVGSEVRGCNGTAFKLPVHVSVLAGLPFASGGLRQSFFTALQSG
jgi:hypothetical protein